MTHTRHRRRRKPATIKSAVIRSAVIESLEERRLLTTFTPLASADLTTALNSAQLGDTIILNAGSTYTGSFTLPNKTTGTGWITIQSSALSSLPAAGVRVGPAHAANMPKIVSPGSNLPAIKTATAAHHYKFVGIEFIAPANNSDIVALISLGTSGTAQDTVDEIPHHFVFDRVYVHANSTSQQFRRGIALNSASTDVLNSYFAEIHQAGSDSQAIGGWNGPGPYNIINNHLEAASENIMFGGAAATVPNLVASDIVVRGNHLIKPLSWRGVWAVKNLFEIKAARRVLIEGNIFENSWTSGQTGIGINLKANLDSPWSVSEDITFQNNIVRHVATAITLQGRDYVNNGGHLKNVTIRNNLFEDINGPAWGGSGWFVLLSNGPQNVTFDHNTGFQSGNLVTVDTYGAPGFVFTNNINPHNAYGIKGDSQGVGDTTITAYLSDSVIRKNVIMGGNPNNYKTRPDNFFPSTWPAVGFVDQANGNYRLSTSSAYKGAGTDGADVGVNMNTLATATAGAISGVWAAPADVTPPTPNPMTWATAPAPVDTTTIRMVATTAADPSGVEYYFDEITGRSGGSDSGWQASPIYTDSGLLPNTTYTYTVRVRDKSPNLNVGTPSATASATTPAPAVTMRYLSDMNPTAATNGWGPYERDRSNGETLAGDGRTITLNGRTYAKGLGVHATSSLRYDLSGLGMTRFQSDIGLDDEVGASGAVVFQVYLDGVKAYDSGIMTGATATKAVDLNITGKTTIELRVTDGGNGNGADHADWANAQINQTTPPPAVTTRYLSDLAPTSASNGWGSYERDRSNGEQATGDGRTITLNGVTYAKGLGVHAASSITYNLAGAYRSFVTDIGVDDEVGTRGSVVFQVFLDGIKVYDSGMMTGTSTTKSLTLDVTGKSTLRLVVTDAGNGNGSDHADWAGARLLT